MTMDSRKTRPTNPREARLGQGGHARPDAVCSEANRSNLRRDERKPINHQNTTGRRAIARKKLNRHRISRAVMAASETDTFNLD